MAASLLEASVENACMTPVFVPPSCSRAALMRSADTSRAHCLRASASKEWASSTTQLRTGGRIRPSASTFLSKRE